jgi:predicted transcriptional regulator
MILHMKQILIQLDDVAAAQLEKIAPGRSRRRSEFLRKVIARALLDTLEPRTREAYERWPDAAVPVAPAEWADEEEAVHPPAKRRRSRRTTRQ